MMRMMLFIVDAVFFCSFYCLNGCHHSPYWIKIFHLVTPLVVVGLALITAAASSDGVSGYINDGGMYVHRS